MEGIAAVKVFAKKGLGLAKLFRNWHRGVKRDGSSFGYWNACKWHSVPLWNQICSYAGKKGRLRPVKVQLHGKPVWLRPATSDYYIYQQVFRDKEYANIDRIGDAKFILDCGANIGLASIYLLNLFPSSRILAVEPDPENASLCRQNLLPYGTRAIVLQGGVWSHCGRLAVVTSEFGAAQKCGMQVRPIEPGDRTSEPGVEAFDIPSLLARGGVEEVDILKIDIERSELVVFSTSYEEWLPKVRNLLIELHDADCSKVVFSALNGFDYQLSERGDVTYCLNLRVRRALN